MTKTPLHRSIEALEADGWLVDIGERRLPRTNITKDLFGFLDLVALRGAETLGVQVTTSSNAAARVRKIAEAPTLATVREAGWRIEVHGWSYSKRSKAWVNRVIDIS